jgi:PleD family two-component response regulator
MYPRPSRPDGRRPFDGVVTDVTERRVATEALRDALDAASRANTELEAAREAAVRLAQTDELTQLPNRRRFADHLAAALADPPRPGHAVGVLLIDIDFFKGIND